MTQNTGEIILYQPDNTLQLEVRLENETVWLTQSQIAELF
ncbi:MAG: DNA-binding protein, partial [Prevotellaceae bacterium]|nr:DNA-binding protein [Prevotellaceae bacterium]